MKILYTFLCTLMFIGQAIGQTDVSGTITTNTTWTAAGSPYHVTSGVTVNTGITLTIESDALVYGQYISVNGTLSVGEGAIIKLDNAQSITVTATGTLNVNGTALKPVYMTSSKDDNWGGDSNGDGSTTAPASGNWYGIKLYSDNLTADYLEIRYAGYSSTGAISFYNVNGSVDHSTISNSYYGIYLTGDAAPTISNTSFGSSEKTPIAMAFTADPVLTNNAMSFSENEYDAIGLLGETMTANRTIKVRGFGAITNLTYLMLGDIIVPAALTLTVEPGVVIKSISNYRFEIQGTLVANGTVADKIVFTSVKDDTYGDPVDTNRDGNITTPVYSDFGGFLFTPTSTISIDNCVIRYAQENGSYYYNASVYKPYNDTYAAINILGGTVSVTNSELRDVQYGIATHYDASPTITNNDLTAVEKSPFMLSLAANPTFSGNTFTSVGFAALALLDGDVINNGTLRKRDVAGYTNITYTTSGTITIKENTLVTVEPGVVVKMAASNSIIVEGGFKLAGTAQDQITFTSLQDDNVGNPLDTNGDGNTTAAAPGNWHAIIYQPSSDDTFNDVNYLNLKYAGRQYSNYIEAYAGLRLVDASFTIDNSNFSETLFWGISFEGTSAATLQNSNISNAGHAPIAISFHANPTFTNVSFSAVKYNTLHLIDTEYKHPQLNSAATLSPRSVAGFTNIPYTSGPYFQILANGALTIAEDVMLKPLGSSNAIDVSGSLNIAGTVSNPVTITSISDDAVGGDSNNDGNLSVPAAGNWGSIYFREGSTGNSITYTNMKFGGYSYNGQILIENTSATLANNNLSFVSGDAFKIVGTANPSITNTQLSNISGHPVNMSMFAAPTFSGNTMSNMGYYAIALIPETYSQTATFIKRDFGGHTNITYTIWGNHTISSGTEITIPDGMVFKAIKRSNYDGTREFVVQGKLNVSGIAADSVVFTHVDDDNYGTPNDTQLNGDISTTGYDFPRWIQYQSGSDATSVIDHTIFKRSGTEAILFQSASATIQNCLFKETHNGIALTGVSSPIINNNQFIDLEPSNYDVGYPITMSLASQIQSHTGNMITGNTAKSIGVITETMVQDATLTKTTFAGINAIPYTFMGSYTVGSGVKLTVDPGVICKFQSSFIDVKGSINAVGTVDQTIVFTYVADDFYGGKTPPDNYSYGTYWTGMTFRDESDDALNQFQFCIFNYDNTANEGMLLESASPSFADCLFMSGEGYTAKLFSITGASNPTINNSDFVLQGTGSAIDNSGSFTVDATNNWWGENTGPTHSANVGGAGATVSDNVNYTPWQQNLATNPQTGDVSLNGTVSAYDAALVLQSVLGSITLDATQTRVANTSGESGVTAMDASYILQHKAGVLSAFPAESTNRRIAATYTQFALSGGEAASGDLINILISLEDVHNVSALQGALLFDTDLFEYVSLEWMEQAQAFGPLHLLNHETQRLHFAMASMDGYRLSGDIAKLTLRIKKGLTGEHQTEITIKNAFANESEVSAISESLRIMGRPEFSQVLNMYPNPIQSGSALKMNYQLSEAGPIAIEVYDISGLLVYSTMKQHTQPGRYQTTWDAQAESGIYVVHLTTNSEKKIQKIVVNK